MYTEEHLAHILQMYSGGYPGFADIIILIHSSYAVQQRLPIR